MECKTITETFDWRNKGLTVEKNRSIPQGDWDIELDRNAVDGTFNIKANDPFGFLKHNFTENNKTVDVNNLGQDGYYDVHSSLLGSTSLDKTESLGILENFGGITSFIDFALFPKSHPMNKNVILKENQYLLLKTINTVNFKIHKSILFGTQYFVDVKPEITYTNTYVVPRKFDALNPTENLFDIYVKNTPGENEDTVGDIGYQDGTMSTSATGATKFKLNTISNKDEKETFDGAPRATTIEVFDITNYDYDKKKVSTGYGDNFEKGVIVPYNFKGNYRRSFNISPNEPFKDLNVTLSNDIKEPTLDPYEGNVVLNIEDLVPKSDDIESKGKKVDMTNIVWKKISSENFERLKDIDPSITGIERLTDENNL